MLAPPLWNPLHHHAPISRPNTSSTHRFSQHESQQSLLFRRPVAHGKLWELQLLETFPGKFGMQRHGLENRWLRFFVVWTVKGQLALRERALCQRAPDHEITALTSLAQHSPVSDTRWLLHQVQAEQHRWAPGADYVSTRIQAGEPRDIIPCDMWQVKGDTFVSRDVKWESETTKGDSCHSPDNWARSGVFTE